MITYPFKTAPSAIRLNKERISFVFYFDNGYGASVIPDGYGIEESPYELAVLSRQYTGWDLCYTSPITDDVVGWLDASAVDLLLERIRNL